MIKWRRAAPSKKTLSLSHFFVCFLLITTASGGKLAAQTLAAKGTDDDANEDLAIDDFINTFNDIGYFFINLEDNVDNIEDQQKQMDNMGSTRSEKTAQIVLFTLFILILILVGSKGLKSQKVSVQTYSLQARILNRFRSYFICT